MQWSVFYFFAITCLVIKARIHDESPENQQHVGMDKINTGEYNLADDMASCDGLSADAGCTNCTDFGHCMRGFVPIDPWLEFALKTQREIQIDKPFDQILIFDSHNAFNNRADGFGAYDTCDWPPSLYGPTCVSIANHEFSLTDQLNMGVRGLELDNWWCYDAMRLVHLAFGKGCMSYHRLYEDAIKEVADWLDIPENKDELVRIYINEKEDQDHDSEMNDPLDIFFGDKILTPLEFNETYGRQWPTMRQMRKDGKNVVIGTTKDDATHGDVFIHKMYWQDIGMKAFSAYPDCGNKSREKALRFYGDSTKYGRAYDGPKESGVILDFTEYVKCHVQFPAADQVNPEIMKTGVFTWAEDEPSTELTQESCVILDGTDKRWHVANSCSDEHFFACQRTEDTELWTMSTSAGPFSLQQTFCPSGFKFSIPHDGYRQEKLLEAANGNTVWLDYTPWLPGYSTQPDTVSALMDDPVDTFTSTATTSKAKPGVMIFSILTILAVVIVVISQFVKQGKHHSCASFVKYDADASPSETGTLVISTSKQDLRTTYATL